jgi:hypothetical protein
MWLAGEAFTFGGFLGLHDGEVLFQLEISRPRTRAYVALNLLVLIREIHVDSR